jgi:threonine aldolase
MIDLRSDTVTKPTPSMRQAMLNAQVGDDVIDIDPTIVALQERTAEMLGKEDAIFMPSGTMTNQIALRCHCMPGDEFVCESQCHIYNYEQGAFAQLSGLVARTLDGNKGLLCSDQLMGIKRKEDDHTVRTRLLCLENTHNRGGGKIYSLELTTELCRLAKSQGILTHLDGARLFNASVATGISLKRLADEFESVSVCFSKGLGAPVGSCLAGSKEFVRKARRVRKLFGGGMRQAGVLAAAALYALDHHIGRLEEDHYHARKLADCINNSLHFEALDAIPDTNIVIFRVQPQWGSAARFAELAKSKNVQVLAFGPQSVRLVTHLDVSQRCIETACKVFSELDKMA